MDALTDIARRWRIPTVADAAAALGARYKDRAIGALGADLSVFSFNGNKTVTAGGGGAIASDDEALAARVRHLTTTARAGVDYDHDMVGFNYRMTNVQAAIGCAQLEQLEPFVAAKRRIARRYDEELGGLPGAGRFPRPAWGESACWFSGVTVTKPTVAEIRPMLRERGVDSRPFWKPIHLQAPYRDAPTESVRECERFWQSILTLPCSTSLTDAEQDAVIAAVRRCFP